MADARTLPDARILVVDDEEANVLLLERVLERAGYHHVASTTDPTKAAQLVETFRPDLVLLDLLMPHLDGFGALEVIRSVVPDDAYLPVLVLTADVTQEARHRALAAGAHDFLTKPIDVDEVLLRIANTLEVAFLHQQVRGEKEGLERRVRERTRELEEAYLETFRRLALAAEYRDDDTGHHTLRVGRLAALVAGELGLPTAQVETIERAAALHDIGKIGVPDGILLAPRKLTVEEFEVVKGHTTIGARILSGSRSPLLLMAEEIAWSHHERWDGSGYMGAAGEEIPLVGRIAAIADVFDALTHERPYKEAWPVDEALAEIARQRGNHFDPQVTDAFLAAHEPAVAVALQGVG